MNCQGDDDSDVGDDDNDDDDDDSRLRLQYLRSLLGPRL